RSANLSSPRSCFVNHDPPLPRQINASVRSLPKPAMGLSSGCPNCRCETNSQPTEQSLNRSLVGDSDRICSPLNPPVKGCGNFATAGPLDPGPRWHQVKVYRMPASRSVTAVLGPTNTGKTHLAVERMLAHA